MTDNLKTKILHTGNKGEWSEIYAFFKILSDQVLYAADEDLEKIQDKYLDVQKVIREEKNKNSNKREKIVYDLTVDRKKESVTLYNFEGEKLRVVDLSKLKGGVRRIFEAIKNTKEGGAFSIPEADQFMDDFLCEQIKASSSDKSDIRLIIHDRFSPVEIESGFSIKSEIGAAPTLLNASKSNTSFIYEILGETDVPKVNGISGNSAVRDRTDAVYGAGGTLKFLRMESETFKRNLRRIDTLMPEIVATMLAHFFRGSGSAVTDLTKALENDPSLKEYDLNEGDYEYKIKQFLEAVALGMTPSKKWNGRAEAQGGYIIVREDGDLVCFHLYNREKFLDYLYENTRFESPSTTRHGYGRVEHEDGKNIFRLNLQVRFKEHGSNNKRKSKSEHVRSAE
jgi:type II restriction enzyme